MTFFVIPIALFSTPFVLWIVVGKHHVEAFAIIHEVAEL